MPSKTAKLTIVIRHQKSSQYPFCIDSRLTQPNISGTGTPCKTYQECLDQIPKHKEQYRDFLKNGGHGLVSWRTADKIRLKTTIVDLVENTQRRELD